jgi:hypothetical protein
MTLRAHQTFLNLDLFLVFLSLLMARQKLPRSSLLSGHKSFRVTFVRSTIPASLRGRHLLCFFDEGCIAIRCS